MACVLIESMACLLIGSSAVIWLCWYQQLLGHTHDLLDAFFSLIGRCVRGNDALSVTALFDLLQQQLSNPPLHKHLQDMIDFEEEQPNYLTSKNVQGVSRTNNYRVFWGRAGDICIQSKRWVTDGQWSQPIVLCTPEDVDALQAIELELVEFEWTQSTAQPISFLAKLRNMLDGMGRDASDLDELEMIWRGAKPEFSKSGETIPEKIARLRAGDRRVATVVAADILVSAILDSPAVAAAFPSTASAHTGATHKGPLISTRRGIAGALGLH